LYYNLTFVDGFSLSLHRLVHVYHEADEGVDVDSLIVNADANDNTAAVVIVNDVVNFADDGNDDEDNVDNVYDNGDGDNNDDDDGSNGVGDGDDDDDDSDDNSDD
jgi:hypothetical protein